MQIIPTGWLSASRLAGRPAARPDSVELKVVVGVGANQKTIIISIIILFLRSPKLKPRDLE